MSSQQSKWIVVIASIACIGCCAIPIYFIIAGASSVGVLTALLNKHNLEVLICLTPLVLIAGYIMYERHQSKKVYCSASRSECCSTYCGSNE